MGTLATLEFPLETFLDFSNSIFTFSNYNLRTVQTHKLRLYYDDKKCKITKPLKHSVLDYFMIKRLASSVRSDSSLL